MQPISEFFTANGLRIHDCAEDSKTDCTKVYSLDGILEVSIIDLQFAMNHPPPNEVDEIISERIVNAPPPEDKGKKVHI